MWVYWLGLIALPVQIGAWFRARQLSEHTSLRAATVWAAVAGLMWIVLTACAFRSSGLFDHAAYGATVFVLTPFIAVLGARRPGHAAWNWFVVLPLVVVLQWPSVSSVFTGSLLAAFELPTPMLLGCMLVVLMGLGNYFGTVFTLPVLLMAAGVGLVLNSLATPDTARETDVHRAISMASILFGLSSALFLRRSQSLLSTSPRATTDLLKDRLNHVWRDFQQLYGTVWSRRVMDRMNQFATRDHWGLRLALFGFLETEADMAPGPRAPDQSVEERVRWVLRRYVDEPWLDARLRDHLNPNQVAYRPEQY